ncbi:MAG: hypothetical protein JO340_04110 [Acidobacteriaceae bacterium]|nr:hypothetical protein [Acidobacteriaceae bacterium]
MGLTFCRTYIGAHETFIDYDPWVLPVASSVQETFTAQYNTGSQFNLTSAASWTSGNTSIATVSAGKVAARAAGTTFVAANDPNTPDYTSGCYAYSIECPLETGEEGQAAGTINATIRLNGTAISSQQPGSIVIGQQATLSMDTGGESVSQATWTVGGTTVASWPAGAPPPTPNFNQNSPVFYWVPPYGGLSAFPTSWSVPISVSGTLSNGTSVVGSASVTVLAPSVSVTPSSSDAIYLINASTVGAECGNTVSTYRMQLAPSVVPPSGISGTYEWVQVENSSGYTYVATDGTQHSCSISQPLPGLDNANPYPNSTNAIFVDSPALAPQPTGKQTITVSKSFSAVLMWQPSGSNSIWVPLSSTN